MSKRILIINRCLDCPNNNEDLYYLFHVCRLTDLKIEDCYNIPDECPLPKIKNGAIIDD